jgi:hypothetical protein
MRACPGAAPLPMASVLIAPLSDEAERIVRSWAANVLKFRGFLLPMF